MFPADVLTRVRAATCAIGYLKIPLEQYRRDVRGPHVHIEGTGFLVRPKIVLTNRHVIRKLRQRVENAGLPMDRQYVIFDRVIDGKVMRYLSGFRRHGWHDSPTKDLGLIEITPDPDFGEWTPLPMRETLAIEVGQERRYVWLPVRVDTTRAGRRPRCQAAVPGRSGFAARIHIGRCAIRRLRECRAHIA